MNRKQEIINAFIHSMKTRGISTDISMSELARRVDIGKSTIYEYFSSKDELIKDAILFMVDSYVDQAITIEGHETMSFEELFKAQLDQLLQITSESKIITEAFMDHVIPALPASIRDEIKTYMKTVKEKLEIQFTAIFMQGFKEDKIQDDVPKEKTLLVSGLVMGSMIRYLNTENDINQKTFINALYDGVLKLLN